VLVETEAKPVRKKSKNRHTGPTDAEHVVSALTLFKLIGQTVERIADVDGTRVAEVEALGAAKSVVAWGESKGFDECQQQAYEVTAGSFILTFHDDIQNNCLSDTSPLEAVDNGRSLHHTKAESQKLRHKKELLVMFLDGLEVQEKGLSQKKSHTTRNASVRKSLVHSPKGLSWSQPRRELQPR
jgi:hypothetical protein